MLQIIYAPSLLLFLQKVKLHIGGAGIYSSMKDYLTLLRHLLQIKGKEVSLIPLFFLLYSTFFSKVGKTPPNPIVSAKTVEKLFTPALPLSAIPSLDFFMSGLGIPTGNQWSTALALRTQDLPERRKKGSAHCTFILFSLTIFFLFFLSFFFFFGSLVMHISLNCVHCYQGLVGLEHSDIQIPRRVLLPFLRRKFHPPRMEDFSRCMKNASGFCIPISRKDRMNNR